MGASKAGASGTDSNRGGASEVGATAAPRADGRPIALITGASRGIGRAIACDLGRDHHVLVGATTQEGAAAVVAELPSAEPFVADVTDPEALAAAVEAAGFGAGESGGESGDDAAGEGAAASGPGGRGGPGRGLDVLVHSAGIWSSSTVENADRDEWLRSMDINVVSVADLTRRLLPPLRAACGTVVTVNSGWGLAATDESTPYSPSKFALRSFTDALRAEERPRLRVTNLYPGRVATDMQREIQGKEYDGSQYTKPQTIAAAVRFVVDCPVDGVVEELRIRPR